jgi:hypothetical protein
MKRTMLLGLTLAFCCSLLQAKSPPKPVNFSGKWILDTGRTKNLPQGLESYSMAVSQNEQQLKVQTILQGDLKPERSPNGPYPSGPEGAGSPGGYPAGSPNGYPGGVGGGMGMPGGRERPMGEGLPGAGMPGGQTPMGEGIPGTGMPGGGRRTGAERRSQGSVAAFTLYPHSAVYNLNGSQSTAQFGGPAHSEGTLKADWAKNGKVLKLALTGQGNSGMGGGGIEMKDQWKLSKDGQSLIIDRSVRSERGSKTVHLIFRRESGAKA